MLIEFQGRQHYESVERFGGSKGFEQRQKNDAIKRDYAKEHGYFLLEIPHTEENIEGIIKDSIEKLKINST